MTLLELYEMLENGELRQHPIFCDGLAVEDYPKVNVAINNALINLYGRFPLKQRQLTLIMHEAIDTYLLNSKYAWSVTKGKALTFIDDGLEPFTDDINKIVGIKDEANYYIPMNDQMDCRSVFTIDTNTVKIPNPVEGNVYFVTYLANHPKISKDSPTNTEITLPENFYPALCNYVGYRLYSGSTDQMALAKANMLLTGYEQQCQQADTFGLTNRDNGTPNMNFYRGGWV